MSQDGGLQWQTWYLGFTDSQGFFGRVANRSTGDPPIKTAAPIGQIGSGGKGDTKSGAISEGEFTQVCVPAATAPRIIALHFGLTAGEGADA